MLNFDALREIDPVRQLADFGFQDVRRRRCAMGDLPLVLPVRQRRLLLRAGQRDAEFPVLVEAERRAPEIAQQCGDLAILERTPVQASRHSGVIALGDELQRAHAVAADGSKKAVGIVAPCPHPLREAAADLAVVRQQIVEDGDDGIADKPVLAQRQRQRYREGLVPGEPVIFVLEVDRAARLPAEAADQAAVQIEARA
jgi:hypothetical protein